MSQFIAEQFLPIETEAQLANAEFLVEGLLDYPKELRNDKGPILLSEVVEREITDKSPCLPEGAVRSTDRYVETTIQLGHLMLLRAEAEREDFNSPVLKPGHLAGFPIEELMHEHPKGFKCTDLVEGYNWYRIYDLDATSSEDRQRDENASNRALILQPWQQPWLKGGAPYPVMYTVGDVTPETQRLIATSLVFDPSKK